MVLVVVSLVLSCSGDETVFLPTGVGGVIVVEACFKISQKRRIAVSPDALYLTRPYLDSRPAARPNRVGFKSRCLDGEYNETPNRIEW